MRYSTKINSSKLVYQYFWSEAGSFDQFFSKNSFLMQNSFKIFFANQFVISIIFFSAEAKMSYVLQVERVTKP